MTTGASGGFSEMDSTIFTPTATSTGGNVAAATSATTPDRGGSSSSSSDSSNGVVALGYGDKISAICIAGLLVVLVWIQIIVSEKGNGNMDMYIKHFWCKDDTWNHMYISLSDFDRMKPSR